MSNISFLYFRPNSDSQLSARLFAVLLPPFFYGGVGKSDAFGSHFLFVGVCILRKCCMQSYCFLSYHAISCSTLSWPGGLVLSCLVQSWPILCCSALGRLTLSWTVTSCGVLSCSASPAVLFVTVQCYPGLHWSALSCSYGRHSSTTQRCQVLEVPVGVYVCVYEYMGMCMCLRVCVRECECLTVCACWYSNRVLSFSNNRVDETIHKLMQTDCELTQLGANISKASFLYFLPSCRFPG